MAVVEAARDGVRTDVPDVPVLGGVEHRQLRFLRRADASLRVEDDDARMRHAMERMGNRAARVARRGRQHGERLISRIQRRHEPRHRPRADVLECQRGTVEQLQRVDAGLDLDDRDGEIQRLDDGCLKGGRVELAARVGPKHAVGDLGQRPRREPLDLARRPLVDRFGNVQTAPRREPLDSIAERSSAERTDRGVRTDAPACF